MWIRSQDKKRLVNATSFVITSYNAIRCENSETSFIIANYSTEEKALKVLDLIQKYIGGMQTQKIIKEADDYYSITSKYDIPFVYCKDGILQMPEDNKI